MFDVSLTKCAQKELYKLNSDVRKRIVSALERCRIRPHAFVKKLVGSPYFRLRVGDYRVIVDIKNDELVILVITIAHRKNVYK